MYGGVATVTSYQDNSIVINAQTNKSYMIKNTAFNGKDEQVMKNIELCYCGLTIRSRTLLPLFGKQELGEFLRWREEYYDDFQYRNFSHENFCLNELNELLAEAKLPPFTKNDFHLKRFSLIILKKDYVNKIISTS